jgi:hypothetical protein
VFGYYLANSSGTPDVTSLHPIFKSTVNAAGTNYTLASLPGGTNYGFYIENIQGANTQFETDYYYFMDSTSNRSFFASSGWGPNGNGGVMPADANQHFVIFQNGTGYNIGVVDADACQGSYKPGVTPCIPQNQFDYQDMLITVNSVPEPASVALFVSGFALTGLLVRRKRQQRTAA